MSLCVLWDKKKIPINPAPRYTNNKLDVLSTDNQVLFWETPESVKQDTLFDTTNLDITNNLPPYNNILTFLNDNSTRSAEVGDKLVEYFGLHEEPYSAKEISSCGQRRWQQQSQRVRALLSGQHHHVCEENTKRTSELC
jgi:hypothetical protein